MNLYEEKRNALIRAAALYAEIYSRRPNYRKKNEKASECWNRLYHKRMNELAMEKGL
jgi:hypothetical protein